MAGSSTHSGSESSKLALKNKEIQFIKTTVEEHPVVIFSKSFCKYCRTARSILDSIGVDYKILELDKRCDGPVLQDALEEMTNARTVNFFPLLVLYSDFLFHSLKPTHCPFYLELLI